ncbi:PREDICTED: phospholipase A1-Igamma3, chloroplastic [Tarenaya hassleriana]|uniref:phospholipase A1-Igamma3, chloroplastic n=1 Tax=Tarenaya hassleriana TaxID=28532 RepID=UPI00053C7229|nr:PREDICTED: phospholipase A1-Igamma3, chloroplastic [Tarenaya hassleriana]
MASQLQHISKPKFFTSHHSEPRSLLQNFLKTRPETVRILKTRDPPKTFPVKCSSSCITPPPDRHKLHQKRTIFPNNDQREEQEQDQDQEQEQEQDVPLHRVWREIQGCNSWEGLLDPMNSHLRREIIRYGEFAQACYDSFDFDPHSKYCGSCKYHPSDFFARLDLATHKAYTITRYLYATSNINLPKFFQKSKLSSVWSKHANWMGYVAVVTDEEEVKRLGRRDIVIAWRGTVTYLEWIYDLKDILYPPNFSEDPSIKIECGFHDLYTKKEDSCKFSSFSAREQVLAEVKRLLDYYGREEHDISITITGHSLGAALALVSAYDIAELNINRIPENSYQVPISVFSFSGPRVGNLKFKERCEELGIKVLRVVNVHDKVPTVPGIFANEKSQFQKYIEETTSFPWSYAHVGVELALDHTKSPFLKPTKDLGCAHSLEALLHLVDGFHGEGGRFHLETKRDVALVNKSCDFLKSEYGVPPCWRQDENKGMVRNGEGRWVLSERARPEAHLPEEIALQLQRVLGDVYGL